MNADLEAQLSDITEQLAQLTAAMKDTTTAVTTMQEHITSMHVKVTSLEKKTADGLLSLPPSASAPSHPPIAHNDGSQPPRYHKLEFPSYDGKDDPLGWLQRC